jgi:Type VI secretion system/phage-baseplate injector OB domain
VSEGAGVAMGIVLDTNDPLRRGRVRVRLPSLSDAEATWARVVKAPAGSPVRLEVQDEVLVVFEGGDVRHPYVIGALWNGSDPPPATKTKALSLPGGSFLQAIPTDIGASRECASAVSVLQQAAPWLASMECLLPILRLLGPLIQIIQTQPTPPPKAVVDFAKAAADLAPCLLLPTPASAIPVVRDLLCLTITSLECLTDHAASGSIPPDLVAALQNILDLSQPFFARANVSPVQLGPLGDRQALQNAIDSLKAAAGTLGGCETGG